MIRAGSWPLRRPRRRWPSPARARSAARSGRAYRSRPSSVGIDYPSTGRKLDGFECSAQPPAADQIATCSSSKRLRKGPGVEFLLPYWLAVYLKILPASA